ncbi:MAG: non-ribosomal peptide synthetase, partial [bacterium]|nr:non-ribosomal peptide synthetase [bacterium]
MDTFEFLTHLEELDVRLRADGGRLRFNAPRGALTEELRAELARRKSRILSLLAAADDTGGPAIERIPREAELPLSFSQQRLWFLVQFEPGTIAFNLAEAVRLRGSPAVAALRRSLREISRRHESLRTTFTAVEGRPVQVIAPVPRLDLPVVDLRRLEPRAREPTAERLAAVAAKQPFDLERGPLIRTVLLRLDEAEHVFLLNIHHIVFDRWSMGVFLEEMTALYRAFTAGPDARSEPSPLPEPEIQYADFAAWQRRRLRGEVLESLRDYWRRQFEGTPGVLRLPTDRPRPPVRTENGARRPVTLPPPLTAALKKLCSEHGTTLFMTLLATFNVLLWRYTSQCDLNVGTVIA